MSPNLNFIQWIRLHLASFGLQLADLGNERAAKQGKLKLWHWSPEGVREMFRDRAQKAGFE